MKVGFTATRKGLSPQQKRLFRRWLEEHDITEFHHGDCIGGDEEGVAIVREVQPDAKVVSHPPSDPKLRTFVKSDIVLPKKPYLDRDRDIVDDTDQLLACPHSTIEQKRGSGTWYTIRYAARKGGLLYIIWPY